MFTIEMIPSYPDICGNWHKEHSWDLWCYKCLVIQWLTLRIVWTSNIVPIELNWVSLHSKSLFSILVFLFQQTFDFFLFTKWSQYFSCIRCHWAWKARFYGVPLILEFYICLIFCILYFIASCILYFISFLYFFLFTKLSLYPLLLSLKGKILYRVCWTL